MGLWSILSGHVTQRLRWTEIMNANMNAEIILNVPSIFSNKPQSGTAASSPLKRPFESTPSSSPAKKKQLLPSPSFTGQKRGIDQVEQQQEDQENVGGGGSWRLLEAFKSRDREVTVSLSLALFYAVVCIEDMKLIVVSWWW